MLVVGVLDWIYCLIEFVVTSSAWFMWTRRYAYLICLPHSVLKYPAPLVTGALSHVHYAILETVFEL